MPTLETFAARFARCVSLFRDPAAKDEQKAEFRALLGLLQDVAVTLRVSAGRLEVNGTPAGGGGGGVVGLLQRLDLHGISEIALPRDPPPAQLFELLRVLADQPGLEDVPSRLRGAGVDRIHVTQAPALPPPPPPLPPPPAGSEQPGDAIPSPHAPRAPAAESLGTDGILRGESWKDIRSVPLKGVPLVTHDPPPPPPATALPGETPPPPAAEGSEELSLSIAPEDEPPAPAAQRAPAVAGPPAPDAPAQRAPAVAGGSAPGAERARRPSGPSVALPPEVAAPLAELDRNPGSAKVSEVLAELGRHAESALKRSRMEQVLRIIGAIVVAEQKVPEASAVRRQYAIALKRIYTKPVLDALTHLVMVPQHRADAVLALQRGGADAVELLVDRLVAAPTAGERRGVFDALRQMTEGTEQLVHMLEHREWFVVRNVAELIGELGMDEAVPALARRLEHDDERVRRAVALALAKIGTRSAAEPLRRALRDKSADVRIQVALGIGGRKSFALAMPLVVALEEEGDETVERELILALGRIGSPDAVQALIKFAQPAGRLFGRKPSALRLAAVEALRVAGTAPAVGTLEGLADDGDRDVRAAARAALTELKRKPR